MKAGDIDVIKMMLIKAHKKLKAAKIDLDNDQYDDSVSRAYYAVYHAISAALFSKGLHFSSHGQTIGAFNREFIKTKNFPSSFAATIRKLFKERQTGDYDFESYIDADVAREDLNYAEKIVNACEKYLSKIYKVKNSYWKE
ncbi:MAG: HEPN domain-containing protein [Nitrospirae bacterium]|nr:HEPN domain-containing protein [Nitrospirota bacterium]